MQKKYTPKFLKTEEPSRPMSRKPAPQKQEQPRQETAGKQASSSPLVWLLSLVLTVALLGMFALGQGLQGGTAADSPRLGLMEKFDMFITNRISDALSGFVTIEKVYWLSDEDVVAPEPDPACFGEATDPAELGWLIEKAARLLDGQELIFGTDTKIVEGTKIKYYLDDTILAITWRETDGRTAFTCSEVKIAHPSQFRRFLSGGDYGTRLLYTTTEMAASVNAVTTSSGDYYSYRSFGNTVYNGVVKRSGDRLLDTCYIDENGDLLFVYKAEIQTLEQVEQYVKDHNIRFSLAFGPILIDDGKMVAKNNYSIGEAGDMYSRAALCQQGPLHYMMVAANYKGTDMVGFGNYLASRGVQKAYALDGGQTATIVTGDELMNEVDYGGERDISDIIYFATAIPDGG